ncbi:hypothetical protein ACFOUP_18050 [Belliella kenyensis]|uniref:ABC transporter ATPase n=1 Tax=Belliella kenyensis TaxID=1472724 RepID=A0ABV8ETG6_9BACT|nr:hypothetical protein [Belliella kenyensis]MCH7402614.1 hypothetical protein [Belliella kenyensis]MDN3603412.1 hypothetical protein [Belliella kenyensis]
MYLEFDQMPAHARVWVYQADRRFTKEELYWIEERLTSFCDQWNTHGSMMPTSFQVKFGQVVILAVDESKLGASGCSIDSSVRVMREIEERFEVNLLDQGKVSFLENEDSLVVNSVFGIKDKVAKGELHPDSITLNPLVKLKGDLENNWLLLAKESWLNKYFQN